ncbi:MAG: DUF4258 domain-containing protein [Planctomycetota bacterium]
MGRLAQLLLAHLRNDRVDVSLHADNRLEERGVELWQVVEGSIDGRLLAERPAAKPNPVIEVSVVLSSGESCKVVWALPRDRSIAKLVTAHFHDKD